MRGFLSYLYGSKRQLGCSRLHTRTESGAATLTAVQRGFAGFSVSENRDNHTPPPTQAGPKAKSAAVCQALR